MGLELSNSSLFPPNKFSSLDSYPTPFSLRAIFTLIQKGLPQKSKIRTSSLLDIFFFFTLPFSLFLFSLSLLEMVTNELEKHEFYKVRIGDINVFYVIGFAIVLGILITWHVLLFDGFWCFRDTFDVGEVLYWDKSIFCSCPTQWVSRPAQNLKCLSYLFSFCRS